MSASEASGRGAISPAIESSDFDLRVADLHYRDVCEWAVGRNAAAGWDAEEERPERVTRVWTDPLPPAEVERVAPNEDVDLKSRVVFGMEALAERASGDGARPWRCPVRLCRSSMRRGSTAERKKLGGLPARRRETGERLVAEMETARKRIATGIDILSRQRDRANRVPVHESRRRHGRAAPQAGATGDPAAQPNPNGGRSSSPSSCSTSPALPIARTPIARSPTCCSFPTGGGKTEAYLGLAAFVIAHRRLTGSGVLGAGVAVIMRYTLRLLTLDQLARAAGVVCALELMRTDPANVDEKGRRLLGDWPIEIGLWVGSDASPNRLGGKGDADETTAVGRVRRYRNGRDKRAPAPLKACPWCGTPFTPQSFRLRAERACADQSGNPLRQHGLRFHAESAAADPDRR